MNCYDIDLDIYFYNRIKYFFGKFYPINKNSFIIFVLNIVHFLLGIFNTFGWMLPSQLLIYHIIVVYSIIISWVILKKCILTTVVNDLSNTNNDKKFLHISDKTLLIILLISSLLSFIGWIYPEISFYNLLYNVLNKYKIYC